MLPMRDDVGAPEVEGAALAGRAPYTPEGRAEKEADAREMLLVLSHVSLQGFKEGRCGVSMGLRSKGA